MTECPFCGSPTSEIRNADFDQLFACGTGVMDEVTFRSQDCYERQVEQLLETIRKLQQGEGK